VSIEDGLVRRQTVISKKKKVYNETVKPKLDRDAEMLKRLKT
jgi:hypothetical protein